MDQYGYMFASFTWEQFVYNHGGQTVDNTENPTKLLLDTSQAIAGLEFMVDLQHRWKVMPSPQVRTAAGLANEPAWFTANRLATVNHGTWQTATFLQAGDNLSWGMTLAPKGQDGKPHYGTGGAGWSIPREAKNPDASFEFIRWQFGPQGWKTWLAGRDPKVFWLPALRAMAEQEAKRLESIYPNASLVVKSAESVFLRPGGVRWERAASEVINPVLADLHQNKLPVRAAVTDMISRPTPSWPASSRRSFQLSGGATRARAAAQSHRSRRRRPRLRLLPQRRACASGWRSANPGWSRIIRAIRSRSAASSIASRRCGRASLVQVAASGETNAR